MRELREFRGTRLPASVINDALDAREVIVLYVGRIQAVRVLFLPASVYGDAIKVVYASHGWPVLVTRETLSAKVISEIVQHQVDGKWNPYTYGEFVAGKKVRAFLVPENVAMCALVERMEGGND